jgi:hypothetical protein
VSLSTLRSLTAWTDISIASLILGGLVNGFARIPSFLPYPETIRVSTWVLALVAVAQVLLAYRATAAFVRRHPFAVNGYAEALHHPAHPLQNPMDTAGRQDVGIVLVFAGNHPSSDRLNRMLRAVALPVGIRLEISDMKREVRLQASGGTQVDGHRRWFARLMKKLSAELVALHHEYPLIRVEITGD